MDLEFHLEGAGMEVFTFNRCDRALAWLEANTPSTAILDLRLPDGSCIPIMNILNARGVAFTIYTADGLAYLDYPSARIVQKPCDPARLVRLAQHKGSACTPADLHLLR